MFDVGVFSFGLQSVLVLEEGHDARCSREHGGKNPYILHNYEVFLKFFI